MNARQRALVRKCVPLVRRVALNVAGRLPSRVDVADLTQAGFLGLIDAALKFDAHKGVRFWTYAELRIRGAILDSLRGLDWLPRSVRRRRRELDAASARLEACLGRTPADDELAKELSLTTAAFRERVDEVRRAEASAELVQGLDGVDLFVRDPDAKSPYELLERRELVVHLTDAIEALSVRERLVMTLYYHEELTMKEVGEILGVNESRVSQIHSKVLETLRSRLERHLRPKPAPLLARTA